VGGAVADDPTQTSPIYLILESKGKHLYVANQGGSSINNGAGIVGYTIDPASSQLSEIPGEPYVTGTGAVPQCLLEDPSDQYIYTANAGDSTVTGRKIDPNAGVLNPVTGWSGSVTLTGPATWCVTTGRTN
jgi:6-phosphogluconolactonase (cycloisomerase 2 family)